MSRERDIEWVCVWEWESLWNLHFQNCIFWAFVRMSCRLYRCESNPFFWFFFCSWFYSFGNYFLYIRIYTLYIISQRLFTTKRHNVFYMCAFVFLTVSQCVCVCMSLYIWVYILLYFLNCIHLYMCINERGWYGVF